MSERLRMAPPRVGWWFIGVWLAAFFAVLALLFPLMPLAAAAWLVLALLAGLPTCRQLLQRAASRRVTRWWLGMSLLSLAALMADFLMTAMPRPRYSDYFPAEQASPVQHFIAANGWTLHWAAGGTAVVAAIAGVFTFQLVMRALREVLAEPASNVARQP